MIESIMYAGIGFLVASLLVIGFIPLVHGRAVRLTIKRLEAMTPMSMAEIQADKDQLRAEFAMSTRRLEMSVEQLKAKTTSQLVEIGKKSEAIGRLKLELGEKTAQLFALEASDKDAHDRLVNTSQELEAKTTALQQTEQTLAEVRTKIEQELAQARARLEKTTADHREAAVTVDNQRVELIALRAQNEVLKGQIESYHKETRDLQQKLAGECANLAATHVDLAHMRLAHRRGDALAPLAIPLAELERGRSETLSNNRIAVAQTVASGLSSLNEGQIVEYELERDRKSGKESAVNLKVG